MSLRRAFCLSALALVALGAFGAAAPARTAAGDLVIGGYFASPIPPIAGKTLDVQLRVLQAGTLRPVPQAAISCAATVLGRSLRAKAYLEQGGRAHCSWTIPAFAVGAVLRGSIRAAYQGSSVSRFFSLRVEQQPEKLTVFGHPDFSPDRAEAGRELLAGIKVRWVRATGVERYLNPKASRLVCGASISGSPLKVVRSEIQAGGVICGWLVPAGTEGKPLVMVVTVTSDGQVASRTFRMRVH
jgi:hypothetical protein